MTNTDRVRAALDLLEIEAQKRAKESSATSDIEARMYLGGQSVGMREVMAKVRAALAEGEIDPPSGLPFAIVGTVEATAAIGRLETIADRALASAEERQAAWSASGCLYAVRSHRDHLAAQVTELQADNTRFTERARAAEWKVIGMLARVGGAPLESLAEAGELDEKGDAVRGWRTMDGALAEMKREPIVITLVRQARTWVAKLDDERFDEAITKSEAIGRLAQEYEEELGLRVVVKGESQ